VGRTLAELMGALPPDRRAEIEARTRELIEEVEGLQALRRLANQSQGAMAAALGIKQPSVHKIERQSDLYLSTLRRFVEAAGGSLEIRVELPGRQPLRLLGLGDLSAPKEVAEAPSARVAEERSPYEGLAGAEAEAGANAPEPEAKPRPKPRRHARRTAWKTPRIRRMRAGDAEERQGGEPALLAS
jgi:transcriptional regulator with XRE-family HTH domain